MKISVFTSNQPRHLALINSLAEICDHVYAVQECNTVFPGAVEDFLKKTDVMQRYFAEVIKAEETVFGSVGFSPNNVSTLSIKSGDLNMLDVDIFRDALDADLFVVFGASWIRKPLIDHLVQRRAINVHMGVSPYYRGAACNFWALYDGKPELVGSTIHRLAPGLDNGGIYFHSMPHAQPDDPSIFGMKAVQAAHLGLVASISDGSIFDCDEVAQQREDEIRYTRVRDFSDDIAQEFLDRKMSATEIGELLSKSPSRDLVRPRYF